jgi:hypothetical protein
MRFKYLILPILLCSCTAKRNIVTVPYTDTVHYHQTILLPVIADSISVSTDSILMLRPGDSIVFTDTAANRFVIKKQIKDLSIKHYTTVKPIVVDTTFTRKGSVTASIKLKPEKTFKTQFIKYLNWFIALGIAIAAVLIVFRIKK